MSAVGLIKPKLHSLENRYQAGENPDLKMMFSRMARLWSHPVHATLVFDGPSRPFGKRELNVKTKEHALTPIVKKFAEAFGFGVHDVRALFQDVFDYYSWPSARLLVKPSWPLMNHFGVIDAVMTDDGDAFPFGVVMAIRNPKISRDNNFVTIYTDSRPSASGQISEQQKRNVKE